MGTPVEENGDVKDIMMAGCAVHLAFRPSEGGGWSIDGTLRCGVGANEDEQSFRTEAHDSREAAEADALRTVTGLLGNNVDRSTSRVHNWTDGEGGIHADDRPSGT